MSKRSLLLVNASLCALALASGIVCAADKPPPGDKAVPLGGVSVHASITDIPPVEGVSAYVDSQQLTQHNTVEADDILAYLPNLTLRKRYIGDRNAILGARAADTLQGARTLVYADGLLLSDFLDSGYGNPPRLIHAYGNRRAASRALTPKRLQALISAGPELT